MIQGTVEGADLACSYFRDVLNRRRWAVLHLDFLLDPWGGGTWTVPRHPLVYRQSRPAKAAIHVQHLSLSIEYCTDSEELAKIVGDYAGSAAFNEDGELFEGGAWFVEQENLTNFWNPWGDSISAVNLLAYPALRTLSITDRHRLLNAWDVLKLVVGGCFPHLEGVQFDGNPAMYLHGEDLAAWDKLRHQSSARRVTIRYRG